MKVIYPENFPNPQELQRLFHDLSNLDYHHLIIQNALSVAQTISEVEAIFIGGSLAQERGDVFSDIDFYMVIPEDVDHNIIRDAFLKKAGMIGKIIHMYHSRAKQQDLILYFHPFIKLELIIRTVSNLKMAWKSGGTSKLLYDRSGLGKQLEEIAANKQLRRQQYDPDIQSLAIALPSLCFIAAGYLVRGEIITTMDFIAWIRRNLVITGGLLAGKVDKGLRKAEQRFPKEMIEFYHTIKIDSVNDCWNSLDIILTWFFDYLAPKMELSGYTTAKSEVKLVHNTIHLLKTEHGDKKKD